MAIVRKHREVYTDEPALDDNNIIIDFPANNKNSNQFKFKQKITENTQKWDKRCINNGSTKISE